MHERNREGQRTERAKGSSTEKGGNEMCQADNYNDNANGDCLDGGTLSPPPTPTALLCYEPQRGHAQRSKQQQQRSLHRYKSTAAERISRRDPWRGRGTLRRGAKGGAHDLSRSGPTHTPEKDTREVEEGREAQQTPFPLHTHARPHRHPHTESCEDGAATCAYSGKGDDDTGTRSRKEMSETEQQQRTRRG